MAMLDALNMKTNMKRPLSRMHALSPTAHVGKEGATEGVVNEIKNQLKKKEIVKVKLLRSALAGMEKKALAERLAERTGALLVGQTGLTAVLYKKKENIPYKKKNIPYKKNEHAGRRR